jgi:hypothetical protein
MTLLRDLPSACFSNSSIRVEFLTTAGPRIIGLFLNGKDGNILGNADNVCYDTPYGEYYLIGGHRLWHAPEAFPRSFLPDGDGLQMEYGNRQVMLIQPDEPGTHFRKSITITLDDEKPLLQMNHTIQNNSLVKVELAPWAITLLPLGGVAVLPTSAPNQGEYAPNRQISLWHYTRWEDDRLKIKNDHLLVQGECRDHPFKIGYFNHKGWAAYWNEGVLFIKRFTPEFTKIHTDQNSNFECFCYNKFIELESLGPLTALEPGESITHTETWNILSDVPNPMTLQGDDPIEQKLGLPE